MYDRHATELALQFRSNEQGIRSRRPTILSGPPPTAPWIGQRSWLGRDDALMKGGKNSRPPWTMVSVKRIYFFGEWWWKRFGIVDLLDRWRDLGDLDHFWSGFEIGLNVYRINCSWKWLLSFKKCRRFVFVLYVSI